MMILHTSSWVKFLEGNLRYWSVWKPQKRKNQSWDSSETSLDFSVWQRELTVSRQHSLAWQAATVSPVGLSRVPPIQWLITSLPNKVLNVDKTIITTSSFTRNVVWTTPTWVVYLCFTHTMKYSVPDFKTESYYHRWTDSNFVGRFGSMSPDACLQPSVSHSRRKCVVSDKESKTH